jgi:hypothetical protein
MLCPELARRARRHPIRYDPFLAASLQGTRRATQARVKGTNAGFPSVEQGFVQAVALHILQTWKNGAVRLPQSSPLRGSMLAHHRLERCSFPKLFLREAAESYGAHCERATLGSLLLAQAQADCST